LKYISFLAFETADELVSAQISSKNHQQRHVPDGIFFRRIIKISKISCLNNNGKSVRLKILAANFVGSHFSHHLTLVELGSVDVFFLQPTCQNDLYFLIVSNISNCSMTH
jgi:hypothetical protein